MLNRRCASACLTRAWIFSVATAADIKDAQAYDGLVAHLMFDARPPKDASLPGGNGVSFDWTLLEGVKFQQPYFLAGGLNPWNVEEAVKLTGHEAAIPKKSYIFATGYQGTPFPRFAEKAKAAGWDYHETATDHFVMEKDPDLTTRVLLGLA